jgi:hypothetical protein
VCAVLGVSVLAVSSGQMFHDYNTIHGDATVKVQPALAIDSPSIPLIAAFHDGLTMERSFLSTEHAPSNSPICAEDCAIIINPLSV